MPKYCRLYVKLQTITLNHLCLNIHAMIRYMIKFMLGSIPHQKIIFLIIYLLEDEQELSLGMLIRLRRIYNFLLFHANIIKLSYTFWQLFILFLGLAY